MREFFRLRMVSESIFEILKNRQSGGNHRPHSNNRSILVVTVDIVAETRLQNVVLQDVEGLKFSL